MATPHVAGVMALVVSQHPDWDYTDVIEQVLGSVDVIDGALKTITGGRLNAAAAVGNPAPDLTGPRVASANPSGVVTGTVNHVRLRFSENIDPATFDVDDIVSFNGPDGPIAVTSVAAASGTRQFDINFDPQTTLGEYTLVLSPQITDVEGHLIDQDRDGLGAEDPDDFFTVTFEISDVARFTSTVDMDIDVLDYLFFGPVESTISVGPNMTISDINVQLDIYYPNVDELKIYVESPSGKRVTLLELFEGYGDNFIGTNFDDEAATPIANGTWPYVGDFRPHSPLSAFNGEKAAGTWTLFIEAHLNDFLAGEGFLDGWSLEIQGDGSGGDDPPPPPPPPDPPPGNRPPVAVDDALEGEVNAALSITSAELLANDTDLDGNDLSIAFVGSPSGGSVGIGANDLIIFTPEPDFVGQASFQYIVSDGFAFDIGNVTIDFAPRFQFHNSILAADVDKDGEASPGDALYIINLLNAFGPGALVSLSADSEPEAYIDVAADNFLAADDALAVINYVNSLPYTPSTPHSLTAEAQSPDIATDVALLSLLLEPKKK
jgi:subtilisin-like proprotein convertase family protein